MTFMDPALHELFEGGAPDEEVAAFIRLRRRGTVPAGVRVVAQFGEVVTCRLRRSDIPRVRADENVESMKGPRLFTPDQEFDAPGFADFGAESRASDERRPPGETADGRGVVVGVIDWGVDFAHPDFINDDGTTRLLAFWDQRTRPEAAAPAPYGYGEVFTSEVINRALKSRDPYAALGYHPADADADRAGTHGTHVLGIAAGNGRGGGPEGVAPAAELVFVHLSMWGKGEHDRIGDSVTIVEALDFVARTAGERPWVVNMSLGRHAGPHDGSTLVEQALDAAVTAAPGRAVVQSAGNYFDRRAHSSGQLRPGESRTLGWKTDVADTTPNELDVWYAGQDHISVEVRAPDGTTSRRVALGERDSITVGAHEVCKIYNRAEDPNNQHNHIDIFLYPGGPAGDWEVTLFGEDVVDGRFHAWIERDAACYHCQSHFDPRDAVTSTTTGTLCNGFRNVAVGAYNAHAPEFEMAPFSSGGPTRDGRVKPDLVAPGVYILSARSAPRHRHPEDSLYTRKSGTSMAAPHVTGTVALMFEVASRPLRIRDTRRLLMTGTRSVPLTPELLVRVGSGVLDTARAVELTRRFYEEHSSQHASKPHTRRGTLARAPAFIGAAAAEAMRGLSELLPGHARCEFVRPGDIIAAASLAQEAAPVGATNESNDTHGAETMNDEQEGARRRCRCSQDDDAASEDNFTEDDFTRDDAGETVKRRNFILLSGGPGPFDDRDLEHDASWASYVTPPLLLSLTPDKKLKKFWAKDEDVWWFVYKPAYEARWASDSASTNANRQKAVKQIKDEGFTSYADKIEKRAADRGWNLRWLSKASDFWSKLKTFNDPISRVWYWGHARHDLWLTVEHEPITGVPLEPSSKALIKTADIAPGLKKHFQKGDNIHRFAGCNTEAFAEAWAAVYHVWAEGIEDKVSFISIHKTGGEPCLVGSASVHYFQPGGAEATWSAPASPYKTCKSLDLGEGLDFVFDEDSESDYVEVPAAFDADEYSIAYESDESVYESSDESDDESVYASDDESDLSPSYASYTPSLVELADAAVTTGAGVVAPGHVLNKMLDPQAYGSSLNPLGSGRALSPAVIYDAFTSAGSASLRQHFENIFEVIGGPRQTFADQLRPGDLILRRGEGGLGHVAVIASHHLLPLEELQSAGLRPEGLRRGLYAQVVEGGAFPHASADGFARLVFEGTGRVPHGQMVLRLRHAPASSGEVSAESSESLFETDEANQPGAPAFPPNAVIDERIDVSAQFALQRMSRGDPSAREDAVGMLAAVKQGELAGIYGDDLKKAAELAARRGTVRWELVPKGEDAALILEPGDATGALPPTIIFRGGNPPQNQGIRNQPQRLDPALRKAWRSFLLLKEGKLKACPLPGQGDPATFGAAAETVTPSILNNVVPALCAAPQKVPPKKTPPVKPQPCAIAPQAKADPSSLTISSIGRLDYTGASFTAASGKTFNVRGTVLYPAKSDGTSKPFNENAVKKAPIVFMAHGQHAVVHRAGNRDDELCEPPLGPSGTVTVENHKGYEYFQEALARMGIIAVSVDCNETNGCRTRLLTQTNINDRADVIAASIKHFQSLNTGSDPIFGGHIDFDSVGLMGHSRGGEAVLVVPSLTGARAVSGVKFKGVISLAPSDTKLAGVRLSGFGLLVILPAADGDVFTSDGAKFYDRATPSPCKTQLYVEDANHNFFNTEWRKDEGHSGPGLMSKGEHKGILTVYGCAFFRARLLGHKVEKILTGQETPPGARADKVQLSAELASALTVDDHQDADAALNALKQKIVQFGYSTAAERQFSQTSTAAPKSFFGDTKGLVLQRKSAPTTNQFTSPLDKLRDLSGREIWVRAAEVYDGSVPVGATGFKLALIDKKNNMVFIDSDETGGVPRPYDRKADDVRLSARHRIVPPADFTKTMPKTFRFPAKCFTTGTKLDIKQIKAVALHLDRGDGRMLAFDQLQIV